MGKAKDPNYGQTKGVTQGDMTNASKHISNQKPSKGEDTGRSTRWERRNNEREVS